MEIKFRIDAERITLNDLIAIEDGLTSRASRALLARCLVDAEGDYMPEEEALQVIGGLNLLVLKRAVADFVAAVNLFSETFVPEALGGN